MYKVNFKKIVCSLRKGGEEGWRGGNLNIRLKIRFNAIHCMYCIFICIMHKCINVCFYKSGFKKRNMEKKKTFKISQEKFSS